MPAPLLDADAIVARNAQARGGLEAWRKVRTMVWSGHVAGQQAKGPMPFQLQLERPNRSRFEIAAGAEHFSRIFDGKTGWKVRPAGATGLPEAHPYTKAESDFERDEFVIDGPLLDHADKGVRIELEGIDKLGDRRAYRMKVWLPSGGQRRIWIDNESFLEVRADRPSTSPFDPKGVIAMLYKDYKDFDGLQIPTVIERGKANGLEVTDVGDRLLIEHVRLNPEFGPRTFAKPETPRAAHPQFQIGAVPGAQGR